MKRFVVLGLLFTLLGCAEQQTRQYGTESPSRERARVHTELGAGYYGQGQLPIALEEFQEAVRIDSSYALAYNGLGLVYAALKEDSKADSNFRRAIQLDSSNPESHNNYGSFLCSRNRVDESIAQFSEAFKNPLYATPGIAYMNAGICSLKKPDEKSAEMYFEKALAVQPILYQAAYQLALIQFNRGQAGLAGETLRLALASADPTADVLWLGVRIQRALGDKSLETAYAIQLRKRYPSSEQTKALISGR
ncbi:MAG: type IV pilus biogenesis/stability protein PilW [Methylophilaceae bacterium]|uniref:type IV pilus biogenesis/stability protein PilW n=1 Tax=Methylovorus sp. MM2 TaxID=1848038 RepID=UPI0007E1003A|nr:type IV pilus biogenesis/stability protein PilW [Methylovorus sp. MM2]OAM53126.1 type IV pilus biogenesis/stability protein PilW [Methylovorus sp. MM2]